LAYIKPHATKSGISDDLLHSARYGILDHTCFGVWLNIGALLDSPSEVENQLTLDSLTELPIQGHVDHVNDSSPNRIPTIISRFTTLVHETRHFHDLISTPYGAHVMRQQMRLYLAFARTLPDLIAAKVWFVPFRSWVQHYPELHGSYATLEAPSEELKSLLTTYDRIESRNALLRRGILPERLPFHRLGYQLSANTILEALAFNFQYSYIVALFGQENALCFHNFIRESPAAGRYLGVQELIATVLRRPHVKVEISNTLLFFALFGNFNSLTQSPAPADILLELLEFLAAARLGQNASKKELLSLIRQFADKSKRPFIDEAAEVSRSSNLELLGELRNAYEDTHSEAVRILADALTDYQTMYEDASRRFVLDPDDFTSPERYFDKVKVLANPLIYLSSEQGVPWSVSWEGKFYPHILNSIKCADLNPEVREKVAHLANENGVIRWAHLFSPRFRIKGRSPETSPELWYKVRGIFSNTHYFLGEDSGALFPKFFTDTIRTSLREASGVDVIDQFGKANERLRLDPGLA
jgi:hypothetical protein